eukprot:COSAG06_NODE_1029_length_11018_cov_1.851923_11_plen_334_part_00
MTQNLFDLPKTTLPPELYLLGVPWAPTVSFREGCHHAPAHILETSQQLDALLPSYPQVFKSGISYEIDSANLIDLNSKISKTAQSLIKSQENKNIENPSSIANLKQVNTACLSTILKIKEKYAEILKQHKYAALVGGEHSISEAALLALSDFYPDFGVLQIDAHMDLRASYQQFHHSHASVMYNALKCPQLTQLSQVGIRDFCEEEVACAKQHAARVACFRDKDIHDAMFQGKSWHTICQEIIATLPKHVYINFDIDGLCPSLCPNTGTPVPGGLSFQMVMYLLDQLIKQQKHIIGFDLVEVAGPAKGLDCIVASHVLLRLCAVTLASRQLIL